MERKDETRVKGFDLPPGAGRGTDDKGHVTLTVDGLEWQLRGAPPWVRVTARWWGDELSDKRQRPWAKLVDGPGGSASMTFPVKAKPAGFSRYCRDARAVVLEFSDGRTARHIASADVDVSRLDVHRPVTRHEVVLATKAGGVLGTVHAECALDYVTGAVSSFELNEHLSRMDDTLPLAPPPSIRAPEAARRRDGDGGGGGRKGGRDAPPFETVATRGAVELEPARWKAHPGTDTRDGPHPPHPSGKENRAVDTEGGRHRALADAREARKKKSNAATSKPASGRDRTTTPAPRDGVLEMAERLRAEMDEALDAAAAGGDDPLATAPADFSKYVAATASDSLTSWWRESAETDRPNDSTPRTSASLTASTARRFMPPDEDDDAALVADQALLDELFRQGIRDDVNDDDDVDDKNDDDAFAASSAVGALALETDSAELEADLAEARAATDAGDGGFRGDDATHRVAKSRLQNGPELELRLTAHAGLVRALERSVALDEDGRAVGDDAGDAPGGFEPLVAILKAGFAPGRELGRVSLDRSGSRGAGEVRVRLPRDVRAGRGTHRRRRGVDRGRVGRLRGRHSCVIVGGCRSRFILAAHGRLRRVGSW